MTDGFGPTIRGVRLSVNFVKGKEGGK